MLSHFFISLEHGVPDNVSKLQRRVYHCCVWYGEGTVCNIAKFLQTTSGRRAKGHYHHQHHHHSHHCCVSDVHDDASSDCLDDPPPARPLRVREGEDMYDRRGSDSSGPTTGIGDSTGAGETTGAGDTSKDEGKPQHKVRHREDRNNDHSNTRHLCSTSNATSTVCWTVAMHRSKHD